MSTTSDPLPANDLLPVVVDKSSYDFEEWIPNSAHLGEVYSGLPDSRSILPLIKSHKIGRKTFSNGGFGGILLRACAVGNVEVVEYLLKIFTQYFSIDMLIDSLETRYVTCSWSALTLVTSEERSGFFKLKNDKVSLLHSAAEGAKLNSVKLLLSAGANVNNSSSWSITPLFSPLLLEHQDMVVFDPGDMVFGDDYEADVNLVLAHLIESGADVHYRDADGLTPLMYAAKLENLRAVQILLEAGSDPYVMDNEGCTALHYACLYRRTAVVRHLLEKAPRLILIQGEHSSSCLAPYLATCHTQYRLTFRKLNRADISSDDSSVVQLCLDDPNCSLEIKCDLKLLRVVSDVIFHLSFHNDAAFVNRMVQLVESVIDLRMDSNLPTPVSEPIAAYGNCADLAKIEDIKSMDPASSQCQQQLVFQSLVTAERCFGYASIRIMQLLCASLRRFTMLDAMLNEEELGLALRLSEMLLFRLQNIQCLTRISWHELIEILNSFFNRVAFKSPHVLLERAINIFEALIQLQQRGSTRFIYTMNNVLRSSCHLMFDSLASLDTSDETARLVAMLINCNCPLLVDGYSGYPESLLHIALSSQRRVNLPLAAIETFLRCGGHRWINTPGVKGCRPLHLALTKEIALLLADHGAHLDAVDAKGRIPKYFNDYYKSHTRPLSCIVAKFIVRTRGIMEQGVGLLPTHLQAFIYLHDSCATRTQIDRQAVECC